MSGTAKYFPGLVAFLATALLSISVSASPWTVPKDKLLLTLNYDFQFADNEFLATGEYQNYPLNGRFTSSTLRIGGRYGFTSRFELAADLVVKSVSYSADAVVLFLPTEPDPLDLPAVRGSVTEFSDTVLGPADFFLTGRYNIVRGLFAMASETRAKLPTGYAKPQGTFDSETGEVADDLALGDGQVDLEESLLFGVFIPTTHTFARADVGVKLRLGGPGHQAIGGVKVGQFLGDHVVLFGGASGGYTFTEGEVIGETIVSTTTSLDPADVVVGENAIPKPLRLDRDWLRVEGGLLFLPTEGVEIQATYAQIVLGSNIAAIQSVSIGTALHFDDLTAEAE